MWGASGRAQRKANGTENSVFIPRLEKWFPSLKKGDEISLPNLKHYGNGWAVSEPYLFPFRVCRAECLCESLEHCSGLTGMDDGTITMEVLRAMM